MKTKFSKPFYCVLDFEANCSDKNTRDHEIIEFPAVLIDATTGKTISEFRQFVKTIYTGQVSKFITELTHITDKDLKSALTWQQTLIQFEEWCDKYNVTAKTTTMITCGDWDLKTMLPRQMMITGLYLQPRLDKLFSSWNNIKFAYKNCLKIKRRSPGMAGMLKNLKLPLIGHHHSGIDDCRNISRIAHKLTTMGWDVTICNNTFF